MPFLVEPTDALSRLAEKLQILGYDWMLVGSVAGYMYGHGRATMDIDVVLDCRNVAPERMSKAFEPEYMLDPEMVRDSAARGMMFNAISLVGAPKVDFAPLPRLPFDREAFARRKAIPWAETTVSIVDPIDLVLSKLRWAKESGSQRQLADVRAIMALGLFDEHDEYFQRWISGLGLAATLDASRSAGYDR
jgi:hypothetical protein